MVGGGTVTGSPRRGEAPRPVALSARYTSARLRTGGSGELAAAHVSEIQRARILSAMFSLASERGAARVSVAHVVERSGVSRRTFYEAFTDREDCFLAAFEQALELASRRVLPAYRGERKWCERVRGALAALLLFLQEEPAVGRLLIVESLSGGSRTLERREQVLALVAEAIDEGRAQSASGTPLPPLTAEGLTGGALAVIHARLARDELEPLTGLSNQLMSMIVLPYKGAAAARRELEQPVPVPSGLSEHTALLADPFKEVGMRLTYRTVRVLSVVAEHPGASNRQVGDRAGISDQGQISKLLRRLQRLELISNTGLAPGRGAPNKWSLTDRGRRFAEGVRTHTEHNNQIRGTDGGDDERS
jgi:AcrR family transcriptional regulator/DNA-binding MarR family transcriptional regulator